MTTQDPQDAQPAPQAPDAADAKTTARNGPCPIIAPDTMSDKQLRDLAQLLIDLDADVGGMPAEKKAELIAYFGPIEPTPLPQRPAKSFDKFRQVKRRASNRR